jgi:hypothetical protein
MSELAQVEQFITNHPMLVAAMVLWTLPWKGVALWRAAKNQQMGWFVALLVVNTLAILEITYIFYFSNPKKNIGESLTSHEGDDAPRL